MSRKNWVVVHRETSTHHAIRTTRFPKGTWVIKTNGIFTFVPAHINRRNVSLIERLLSSRCPRWEVNRHHPRCGRIVA